jgi:hypothetical protein
MAAWTAPSHWRDSVAGELEEVVVPTRLSSLRRPVAGIERAALLIGRSTSRVRTAIPSRRMKDRR